MGEIVVNHPFVRHAGDLSGFEESFDLRRKEEGRAIPDVIERLDAEPVARAEEFFLSGIVESKAPHPVQMLDTIGSPGNVRIDNDFGIRLRAKDKALGPKLLPELDIVVDFPVEDYPDILLRIRHRLMAGGGEIDDAQPPPGECEVGLVRRAFRRFYVRMIDLGSGF